MCFIKQPVKKKNFLDFGCRFNHTNRVQCNMMRLEKQSTPRYVVGYKRGFNLNIVESYQSIVKVQLKAFSVIRYVENWVLLFQNC